MFRYERSGVVGGLSRVRQMTLNDGHVFCAAEQVESEIATIMSLVAEAYQALAIPAPSLRLSLRDPGPKHVGEAAFYGPKVDLQVTDPHGGEQTLSTIQVDFYLPGRFDLSYRRGVDREQPVMVHRSIVSTMERMVVASPGGAQRGAAGVAGADTGRRPPGRRPGAYPHDRGARRAPPGWTARRAR